MREATGCILGSMPIQKICLGNPRVHQYSLGGTIDIGAYESVYNPTVVPGAFGVAYVRTSYYGNGNGSSWKNATVSLQDIMPTALRMFL